MGALFIKTADFKLAYRLMKALRKRGIDFVHISEDESLPNDTSVWLGTPEEVKASSAGIGVACSISDVDISIEKALHISTQKNPAGILAFGVDPGPRPGLAWNSDGKPIGAQQMELSLIHI